MTAALKSLIRPLIPRFLLSWYHLALSYAGALLYGFPSRRMTVIAVTGTKGKSSVAEMLFCMLREQGFHTALISTVRFAIDEESEPNRFKMTLRGRFFAQRYLAKALARGATHAVVEITSEAVVQWRHRFIELNGLIFTNIAREHIESHGSFENYLAAKLRLAAHLARSKKRPRVVVANADDPHGKEFLAVEAEARLPFSFQDAQPSVSEPAGSRFTWRGEIFELPLAGTFNVMNALAALTMGQALGVATGAMKRALGNIRTIPGRTEVIALGQDFTAVVDYAHTPESLQAIYDAFPGRRICVLGNTGGGRDRWKREVMGAIADAMCDVAILTDEDPYDEDPQAILAEMEKGFTRLTPQKILDRRLAIRTALLAAKAGDRVIVTGKGTDPYIMRAGGRKEPWSDRAVVEEELRSLLGK